MREYNKNCPHCRERLQFNFPEHEDVITGIYCHKCGLHMSAKRVCEIEIYQLSVPVEVNL